MNPAAILAVAAGGALGSVARYLAGIYAAQWLGAGFPWGTLFVNVTGGFLIGALAETFALRGDPGTTVRALLVAGVCGGYTTFSAFSLDVVTLVNRGETMLAAAYVVASVLLSLAALFAALHLLRAVLA